MLGLALAAGSSLRLLAGSSRRLIATDLGGPRAHFTINALLGTSDSLAFYVAGPVLGGTLAALLAPGPVLLLDGLCFLPLLGVALLAIPAVTGHHADHGGEPTSGWTILRQVPVAAWLFAVVFCFNLFYMPVEVSLPLLVRGPLHGSDAALGVLWTSFGIGALAGALATNQLRRLAPTRVLVGIIAGWACCVGLLTVAPDVTVAAIALGVGGLIYAPFIAVAYSLVQAALQPRQQQPVLTLWAAGATIAAPIGLAMAGPLVQLTGIRGGLAVSALLTIALVSPATRALHTRRSP